MFFENIIIINDRPLNDNAHLLSVGATLTIYNAVQPVRIKNILLVTARMVQPNVTENLARTLAKVLIKFPVCCGIAGKSST